MTEQQTSGYRYCHNCHYPMPPQAKYCPQCSQHYTDGRETFGHMIHELIHTKFHLDSAFFNTLRYIFIPGKLTLEYFQGKHKRYAHPVRLFLVLGVLCFALIQGKLFYHDKNTPVHNSIYAEIARVEIAEQMDSLQERWLLHHPGKGEKAVLDSVRHFLMEGEDSVSLGNIVSLGTDQGTPLRLSKHDAFLLPHDSLVKKYDIKGFWSELGVKQARRAIIEGEYGLKYFISKLFYTLFLMLPVIALFMKLLYIRHTYLFVEHFIFLLHYHCFLFALMSVLMFFSQYVSNLVIGLSVAGTAVFFFLALRRVYRQGWFKTLVKQQILLGFYILIMILFITITALYTFFTF